MLTISLPELIDLFLKVGVLKYLRRALRFPNVTKVFPSEILESGKAIIAFKITWHLPYLEILQITQDEKSDLL